jgi:hypothetical protein
MTKPAKTPPAADVTTPATRGQWLVLIGETCADDIEAFFADIWPEVEERETCLQ